MEHQDVSTVPPNALESARDCMTHHDLYHRVDHDGRARRTEFRRHMSPNAPTRSKSTPRVPAVLTGRRRGRRRRQERE